MSMLGLSDVMNDVVHKCFGSLIVREEKKHSKNQKYEVEACIFYDAPVPLFGDSARLSLAPEYLTEKWKVTSHDDTKSTSTVHRIDQSGDDQSSSIRALPE